MRNFQVIQRGQLREIKFMLFFFLISSGVVGGGDDMEWGDAQCRMRKDEGNKSEDLNFHSPSMHAPGPLRFCSAGCAFAGALFTLAACSFLERQRIPTNLLLSCPGSGQRAHVCIQHRSWAPVFMAEVQIGGSPWRGAVRQSSVRQDWGCCCYLLLLRIQAWAYMETYFSCSKENRFPA